MKYVLDAFQLHGWYSVELLLLATREITFCLWAKSLDVGPQKHHGGQNKVASLQIAAHASEKSLFWIKSHLKLVPKATFLNKQYAYIIHPNLYKPNFENVIKIQTLLLMLLFSFNVTFYGTNKLKFIIEP